MDVPQTIAQPPRRAIIAPRRLRRDTGPTRRTEIIQRGRMLVDIATAILAATEARLGPFDEATWRDRRLLDDARRAWDRLRAEWGTRALESALEQPPVRSLPLAGGAAQFLLIAGKTYRVAFLPGNDLAPRLYRLTRLPDHDDGPYYACRLRDGQTQCDCGEWIYHVAEIPDAPPCKHLNALRALAWI